MCCAQLSFRSEGRGLYLTVRRDIALCPEGKHSEAVEVVKRPAWAGASRGEKVPLGAVHRRPQQITGEKFGLSGRTPVSARVGFSGRVGFIRRRRFEGPPSIRPTNCPG